MLLEHDLEIFNKLKRYDVSLMLHIQPATLSRVLNRLKRDEMIDIDKGNIIILDHERLQHIYKGFL
jgi:CRP/FNR family transcriptional regulator